MKRSSCCFCPSWLPLTLPQAYGRGFQLSHCVFQIIFWRSHSLYHLSAGVLVTGHLPVPHLYHSDLEPQIILKEASGKIKSASVCGWGPGLWCRKSALIHLSSHLASDKYWLCDLQGYGLNSIDLTGWLWKLNELIYLRWMAIGNLININSSLPLFSSLFMYMWHEEWELVSS